MKNLLPIEFSRFQGWRLNIAMNSCMGAYEFNIKGIKLFAFLFLKKKKKEEVICLLHCCDLLVTEG